MPKTFTLSQLERKRYDQLKLSDHFTPHLGCPTRNFSLSITGESGNGKTSYTMQLVKDIILNENGRLLYVSSEEGDDATFQAAAKRADLFSLNPKKFKGITQCGYNDIRDEINANKGEKYRFLILDSIDSIGMTYNQWATLRDENRDLAIIAISWMDKGLPKSQYAKDIFYMSNIKIIVENYVAVVRSCRYEGGGADFVIWEAGARKFGRKGTLQGTLFEKS